MLIIGAILEDFRSLKDKTLKLTFSTNEPVPEQILGIANLIQRFGYLAFKEDAFKTEEIQILEDLEADYEDKSKTPAKRLRNVLYVAWKEDNKGYEDFNRFYDFQMEKMITHWKSKLT